MSYIFLSHSNTDEVETVAIKQWLLDNGWDDVFLDLVMSRNSIPWSTCGIAAGRADSRKKR